VFALLVIHALFAAAAPAVARRIGTNVFWFCAVAPAATFVWAAGRAADVVDGTVHEETLRWVAALDLEVTLRLDAFALLMVMLVAGIGTLILAWSAGYFEQRDDLGRFAALMTAFAASMLGVVLADNLLALYLFWELTSVTSYLLIGFDDRKGSARGAALQAILVTGGGGLAMLGGFVVLGDAAGTYSISGILDRPPSGTTVGVALVLVLLGAFTKSAQVPFHAWLPGAMAAPTPASAYLHSATMVKAGVYLVARLAPAFAPLYAFWRPLVLTVGVATMLVGGYRALRQHDLKLLLAFGTVSQLGFIMVLVGAGHPELTFAGVALLLAHGMFKATLFMVVGIVDHQAHTRDLRRLDGLGRRMPLTFAVAAVAVASMAGIWPFLGFAVKEAALEALDHTGLVLALWGVVAGSALTFAYGARFLWGAFASEQPRRSAAVHEHEVAAPPFAFVLPALALCAATVAFGVWLRPITRLAASAAEALDGRVTDPELYLWHGVTLALGLSIVSVAAGASMFAARARVERLQARLAPRAGAQQAYEWSVRHLNRFAERTTGVVQNGSLPVYLAIVLATAVVAPGAVLLTRTRLPDEVVLAVAIGAATVRRRFAAVVLLGGVGFGVAVLFVIQGAPDLALTQFLVETLALVVFVLVLRHLPERFEPVPWRFATVTRLAVSLGVGVFVTAFALVASGARRDEPITEELVARSLPEGGGRNVVNVILTDFRALDTVGEITVLTVAAFGVASLVLAGRSRDGKSGRDES
jgi:multicomponent Na+:H+ antiporter subunit A